MHIDHLNLRFPSRVLPAAALAGVAMCNSVVPLHAEPAQPASVIAVAREIGPGQQSVLKLGGVERMDSCVLAADGKSAAITLGGGSSGGAAGSTLNLGRAAKCLLVHSFEAGVTQQVCAVFSADAGSGSYNELVIFGTDGGGGGAGAGGAMRERARCSLPGKPLKTVAADLNGDAIAEIVVVTLSGGAARPTLTVFGSRDGRLEPLAAPVDVLKDADDEPTSIDPADLDDDKDLDLVIRGSGKRAGANAEPMRQTITNQWSPTAPLRFEGGPVLSER